MTTLSSFTLPLPAATIFGTRSKPFTTSPKIVWPRSSQGVATSVMKNYEPFVPGPAFAIARSPGLLNLLSGPISSANL